MRLADALVTICGKQVRRGSCVGVSHFMKWDAILALKALAVFGITCAKTKGTLDRGCQPFFVTIVMTLSGQTGRRRHSVLNLSVHSSVRPSVCYKTCENNILKLNEPILKPTGTNGPRGIGKRRVLRSEGTTLNILLRPSD